MQLFVYITDILVIAILAIRSGSALDGKTSKINVNKYDN